MKSSWTVVLRLGALMTLSLSIVPPAWGQVTIEGSAIGGFTEYRSNATGTVDRTSGSVGGFQVHATTSLLEAELSLRGGKLNSVNPVGDDRDVAEARAGVSLMAAPWLALQAGGFLRTYSSTFARERWTGVQVGAEGRPRFIIAPLRALFRASLMPVVSVTGSPNPDLAVAAATGLEWESRRFTLTLTYALERYDFPRVDTFRRSEQSSGLTAQLGWRIGPQRGR